MNTFGLDEKSFALVVEVLSNCIGLDEAIIFGSRAMGTHRPGSDVDLAVKGPLSEEDVLTLSATLNERIPVPYRFDVLHFDHLSNDELKAHVKRVGKTFFKKD